MKKFLLWLLTLTITLPALARDFEYTYKDQTLTYTVINETLKTCSAKKSSNAPSGILEIPSTVSDGTNNFSVTSIGNSAFSYCNGLTSVTIPNSVTSIGNSAFYSCAGLTSVAIPNSVTSIKGCAFYDCSGLISVVIPPSVTSIENSVFVGCEDLRKSAYPNTLKDPFSESFSVAYNPEGAICENGFIYGPEKSSILYAPITLTGEYTIPNFVTSIGNYAFSNCDNLTSVTIPNSVTSIGNWAFYDCYGLTSVTIPNSVTSIDRSAFEACRRLISVTIPNSVTSISEFAFYDCSDLTEVTIPNSVTSIGSNAFGFGLGSHIRTIYSDIVDPVKCKATAAFNHNIYSFKYGAVTLSVPAGTAAKYRATAPWSNFTNIVERAPEGPVATFAMADATLRMGQEVTVPVSMNNSVDITSFQCDIHLPAGFEVVTDAQGAPSVAMSDRKSATHAIESAVMTDGTVRVTCFSANNAPFSGSEGELFTVKLQPVSAAVGVHELTIDNIVAAKPDAKGVNIEPAKCSITLQKALMPGDVTNDDVVNVSDAIATINYILGKAPETYLLENADVNGDEVINILDVTEIIQIVLGTSQSQNQAPTNVRRQNEAATTDAEALYIEDFEIYNGFPGWMPIKLRADQNYTGFQSDIYLPEGLEVLTRTEGYRTYPDVQLHDACNSGSHLVSAAMQPDGALRVISLSMANAMYGQSADNTLFMVRVRVKPDFTTPVLSPVQFRNTLFHTGAAESHFAPSQSIIDINDFLAGVENVTAAPADAQYFNLQGMPVHNPQKGMIYIRKTAASAEKVVY